MATMADLNEMLRQVEQQVTASRTALELLDRDQQATLAEVRQERDALNLRVQAGQQEADTLRAEVARLTAERRARGPRLGAKLDNQTPEGVAAFEAVVGRPLDFVVAFLSDKSWSNPQGDFLALRYWLPILARLDRPVYFSWPLCPRIGGTPMAEVVAGKRDAEVIRETRLLNNWRPQDPEVVVRLSWEMNGEADGKPWFEWARESAQTYVAAFRRVVLILRQHCPRIKVAWCPSLQTNTVAGTEAFWPGREFVDLVTADIYAERQYGGDEAWQRLDRHPVNLRWLIAFALREDRPWGLDEVACTPQQPQFIDRLAEVLDAHRPRHLGWWHSSAKYDGRLAGATAEAFKSRFGG